jgi:hypothetical protein
MVVILCFFCSACALHHAGNWRLTKNRSGNVLIPPDVKQAGLERRTFTPAVGVLTQCPSEPAVQIGGHGKRTRVTVTRDDLIKQPTGSLAAWAWKWESAGCVAPGDGMKLATAISESLPLDPATVFRLLFNDPRQASGVDLDRQTRLRVVSPVLRDRKLGILEPPSVTGTDSSLILTAKATDNLLGYETSLYMLRPKIRQTGYTIAVVSSERHMISSSANEPLAEPSINYFDFPPEAAFYRFFYESWRNDLSAMVIAAGSRAELDQLTAKVDASGSAVSCKDLAPAMCLQIPKEVAVNPFVAITVNGAEMLISRGTTLRQVILAAKERNPDELLPRLQVEKTWRSRMVAVKYDRRDAGILTLPMQGGEIVSWR